jgi:hypothetical protein
MLELFVQILPLAIASAASPVIFAIAIALLSKKNLGGAAAFFAGGLAVAAILAAAGISIAAEDDKFAESIGKSPAMIDAAVGLLFLAFGIKVLFDKPKEKEEARPAINAGGRHFRWFAIGFLANITNFDAVLLNLAAVREIFNSSIASIPKLELLAFCDFFLLLPSLLPIAFYIIAPERSQRMLVPVENAMKKYGQYVVGAIFIIFGAYMMLRVI